MPNIHVNESMAVGHYKASVTYDNEKFRPLTGTKNGEVVPNTRLPEFDVVTFSGETALNILGNWIPDYKDPAMITYHASELTEAKRSRAAWRLFFYQDRRVSIECLFGGGLARPVACLNEPTNFTVKWKKTMEYGDISIGFFIFQPRFAFTSLVGVDKNLGPTPVIPISPLQYIWAPSDASEVQANEGEQAFRIVIPPPAAIKTLKVMFGIPLGKRPIRGSDTIHIDSYFCP